MAMTPTAEYTISLIRSLMREQPAPPIPEGIGLQALLDFSRFHSVEALVFRGLGPVVTHPEDPVWKSWEGRVNLLLAQSIVQLQERDELVQKLTEAGIDLLPLKGCCLKERYPEINDRQMSDLDMLIHPEDAAAAERLLLARGYRIDDAYYHHTSYIKEPYLVLEIHVSLLPAGDEHSAYFERVWDRVAPSGDVPHLYTLKPEDEYLFYLAHLSKHLSDGGSGLRSILDQWIYSRCFPHMDEAYLERELKTLGLWELAGKVRALSRCWFETGQAIPESLRPMAQAVCDAGTYGSLEVQARQRMEQLRIDHPNPIARLWAYCVPRFFRPLSVMKRQYPVLCKLPVLLPVFWLVRILSLMLDSKASFWKRLRLVFREGGKHG